MADVDPTCERLLAAAGQVFADDGFQGGTVRKIIDRAGVNIAAVNYHFGDKEHLYIQAVKYAHGDFMKGMVLPAWPANTSPIQKLSDFIHQFVTRLMDPDRPAWHAILIMRELAQPTKACFEIVRDNIRPLSEVLGSILSEILPPNTTTATRFMTAFSIIGQCLYYCQNKPIAMLLVGEDEFKQWDATTVANHITQFTLAALGLAKPICRAEVPA